MRQILSNICFLFSFLAVGQTLPAASSGPNLWVEVCRTADNHSVTVKTKNHGSVTGACSNVDETQIQLFTHERGLLTISRRDVTAIYKRVQTTNHQLATLKQDVGQQFHQDFRWLFSPAAPLGLVAVPITAVWGAVAAPFCWIGDLMHPGGPQRD